MSKKEENLADLKVNFWKEGEKIAYLLHTSTYPDNEIVGYLHSLVDQLYYTIILEVTEFGKFKKPEE